MGIGVASSDYHYIDLILDECQAGERDWLTNETAATQLQVRLTSVGLVRQRNCMWQLDPTRILVTLEKEKCLDTVEVDGHTGRHSFHCVEGRELMHQNLYGNAKTC